MKLSTKIKKAKQDLIDHRQQIKILEQFSPKDPKIPTLKARARMIEASLECWFEETPKGFPVNNHWSEQLGKYVTIPE